MNTKTTPIELAPCPWCKGQPYYLKTEMPSKSWIGCDNYKCGIKPHTPYCKTWDRAVELWDTRIKEE